MIDTVKPVAVAVVLPNVGSNAAPSGVAGAELADARLIPTAFLATTLITYAVPLVRPATVHEVAVDTGSVKFFHVAPLLLEYFTRYSVIAEPPVFAGAVHVTASWVLPLVATTDVGLPGTVAAGVAGAEFADGGLMPAAFLATTLIT